MIVVVGEALIDLVLRPSGEMAPHPGGGPYNAARALARLEVPTAFLGRLSTDRFGRMLREALVADGVAVDTVELTADPTTLALAELDEQGSASYHFYVAGTSVPALSVESALARYPEHVDALHVGTLALVLDPLADAVEALVARAHSQATMVFVDPNIRPLLIADRAHYLARLARVMDRADVVKLSSDDLAWLTPDRSTQEAATELASRGTAVVVVTLGASGALAVTSEGHVAVDGLAVDVADTIGAGDTFGAALLAWWWSNGRPSLHRVDTIGHAMRFACVASAITCSRPGADPPYLRELAP